MTTETKPEWETIGGCICRVSRGGRSLVISVSPVGKRRWVAIAIEGPMRVDSVDDVTSDHAHRNLGEHKTLRAALDRSERFAEVWVPGEAETCACPELDDAP